MDIHNIKRVTREKYRKIRRSVSKDDRRVSAYSAIEHFRRHIKIPDKSNIAAYFPFAEEFDVIPLAEELRKQGHKIFLPRIKEEGAPLVFLPAPEDLSKKNLEYSGRYRVYEPKDGHTAAEPNILLVPLVAFDGAGNRLGLGAGYYDRSIASLREKPGGKLVVIGVGYSQQQAENIPQESFDQRLDWALTESLALKFV